MGKNEKFPPSEEHPEEKILREAPKNLEQERFLEERGFIGATEDRAKKLETLRNEIIGEAPEDSELLDRVKSARLPRQLASPPIELLPEQKELVSAIAAETREHLEQNYHRGFGVSPSAEPESNFYNQVYARDGAQAAGNYFASANPEALKDSLRTIFQYQRPDGALPLRVEREYQQLKLWPGLKLLAKPLFNLIETRIKGKREHPVFEGGDFGASGSEDTIPALLISVGEFFIASKEGKDFTKEHFDQLEKAVGFFRGKTDERDGLAVATRINPDWADSLVRKGKLGGINVWWARGLRLMEFMSKQLGENEKARQYKEEFRKTKASVLEKLYNSDEGYFRTKEGEDRVDTVASVFGALYLLDAEEAVKVEETLARRVARPSGLRNFDPPYPQGEIFGGHRFMGWLAKIKKTITGGQEHGMDEYHNKFVWPWVTLENIQVKIKIALRHRDETVRSRYKKEAVDDLLRASELFKKLGGAYEVVDPEKPEPARIAFYTPPKNLMGSMAAYQGAYIQMKELRWI